MRARNPVAGLRQKLRVKLKQLGVKGKFTTDLHRSLGGVAGLTLVVTLEEYQLLPHQAQFEGYPVRIQMPHKWQAIIAAYGEGRAIQHRCMANDHHAPNEWYQWEDADLTHIDNSYFEWRIKETQ